ncbi:MAG: hypothetical protein ACP5NX_04200, partial [Candidatus Bilamarchaeaceae archaeon]
MHFELQGTACFGSLFIIGLALLAAGANQYLLRQKIKNTPTSKVRSAALGLAELFGKARAFGDMRSPLEGKTCAYWYVVMEEYRQSRKHSGWQRS